MVNIWLLYGYYMVIIWLITVNNNLVGAAITILKNMSSSMGRIIYPIYEMENKKCVKPPKSHEMTHFPRQ